MAGINWVNFLLYIALANFTAISCQNDIDENDTIDTYLQPNAIPIDFPQPTYRSDDIVDQTFDDLKSVLGPDYVEFIARLEQQEPVYSSDNFNYLDYPQSNAISVNFPQLTLRSDDTVDQTFDDLKSILSPDHVEFTARLEQQEPVYSSDNFNYLDYPQSNAISVNFPQLTLRSNDTVDQTFDDLKSILSPDHVEFTARLEQQEPVSDNFICLDSFDLESILGPDSDEQKYKCGYPGCKWTIPDIKDYIEHIRIHNPRGVNMCHWYGCKKSFRTLVKLRKHQRLHQFKFECENCWRLFNNKHACKAHKKCCSKNFP